MQGVLTKRHLLANPVVVIRHFGLGVFWAALWAPEEATFLEVLARHEFRQKRGEELRLAHRVDVLAEKLQRRALSHEVFTSSALGSVEQLDQLMALIAQARGARPPVAPGNGDPLMSKFQLLLTALAAKEGPVRAALGTLSPSELVAVEGRVLRSMQNRCADEVEQLLGHAATQAELIRAHLLRLFRGLEGEGQGRLLKAASSSAAKLLTG